MKIPNFNTKEEKFKFLKENKQDFIAAKKSQNKNADPVSRSSSFFNKKGETVKVLLAEDMQEESVLKALLVINTTNLLDSHDDVHIPGLWKKSLSEIKNVYLLQEHSMTFDKIIADSSKNNLVASVKNYDWSKLGYPEYEGKTQALIFETEIDPERNEFMHCQYMKGYVVEHSVGMRYVTMLLCIDSKEKYYAEEKANWDKYITEVANKQDAIDNGMFWAITEAKLIEGSAVVKGSNFATPTISITTMEAGKTTPEKIEPLNSTQKTIDNLNYLANNFKL